ncbi:MAG TPA: methyl-accepting chemotaxis protein, partial [Ignavibacteriaceae bacterium]
TEQFTQSVQEVSHHAHETAEAAQRSKKEVGISSQSIIESMTATSHVVQAVQTSNHKLEKLNESTKKIGDISSVIAEIAGQTNLLALNAAIEAARAGEAGRGFAVVADEVRKLAERTTASTGDIGRTVDEIRTVTEQAVDSMNIAVKEVEMGISKLQNSVSGLDRVNESSSTVATMAVQISDASKEQGVASEDVAKNMQTVADLIQKNAESATNAKKTAHHLLETTKKLEKLASIFRLYK